MIQYLPVPVLVAPCPNIFVCGLNEELNNGCVFDPNEVGPNIGAPTFVDPKPPNVGCAGLTGLNSDPPVCGCV